MSNDKESQKKSIDRKKKLSIIFSTVGEIFLWIVFKVIIPGAPFFLALILDHYTIIGLNEKIEIIMKSDVFVLGASIATNVLESSVKIEAPHSKYGIIASVISYIFFFGIYLMLYVPNIGYVFRNLKLEENFWTIITIAGVGIIILGIAIDVFYPIFKKRRL